jgi:hypothetical protein
MYTDHTYQDWEAAAEADRRKMLQEIVNRYKGSEEFKLMLDANEYFRGNNTAVGSKVLLKPVAVTSTDKKTGAACKRTQLKEIVGNRVRSNFLFRFITQQNQHLLSNGVTLGKPADKERLGMGFDKALEQAGERALLHGVCWLYWNNDHVEVLPACTDALSGCVALLDERSGSPAVAVQFWQLDGDRPLYVRLFELDGVTEYRQQDNDLTEIAPKRAYKLTVSRDAAGEQIISAENYARLPVVPLYASAEKRSEMTPSIKSKIYLYDRILSDFGDNLYKSNDIYWVLNNFGGSMDEVAEMVEQIEQLRAVVNVSDGSGSSSTASPMAFEVPYEARRTALDMLERALYGDFMALDMDALTGGSLTNVAIKAAEKDLNLKCDRYEWQVFSTVQQLLALIGVETEQIRFKRQELVNESELIQNIVAMREDIDHETALKLNPYIMDEEIEKIMDNVAAEQVSGMPTMTQLVKELEGGDA